MESELPAVEREILGIAEEMASAKKTITMESLHQAAKRKLAAKKDAISVGIYNLILKKYIIIGSKMTKAQVLSNSKRNRMYNYILESPGAHLSEIKKFIEIKGALAKWHLSILEKFGFIYSVKYLKYLAFFPKDFNRQITIPYLALRDKNPRKIFQTLIENPVLPLSEIKTLIPLDLPTLKHHLNKLIDAKVIQIQEISGEAYYLLNIM